MNTIESMNKNSSVVAIYPSHTAAEAAIKELQKSGWGTVAMGCTTAVGRSFGASVQQLAPDAILQGMKCRVLARGLCAKVIISTEPINFYRFIEILQLQVLVGTPGLNRLVSFEVCYQKSFLNLCRMVIQQKYIFHANICKKAIFSPHQLRSLELIRRKCPWQIGNNLAATGRHQKDLNHKESPILS